MYRLIAKGGDITDKSASMSWSTDTDAVGSILSFESIYSIPMGEPIALEIGGQEAFRGIITGKSGAQKIYTYSATDLGIFLRRRVTKQFAAASGDIAIKSLLTEYGVGCSVCPLSVGVYELFEDIEIIEIVRSIIRTQSKADGKQYALMMVGEALHISEAAKQGVKSRFIVEDAVIAESSLSVDGTGAQLLTERVSAKLLVTSGGLDIRAGRMIDLELGEGERLIKSAAHSLENGRHMVQIELEWLNELGI